MDFGSSREMVVVAGWVMAVSDFFGHVGKVVALRVRSVERERIQVGNGKTLMTSVASNANANLSSLCKCIRVTLNTINNLNKKKERLAERIGKALKQSNSPLSPEEFVNYREENEEKGLEKMRKLGEFLAAEKTLMKERKRFWAWMVCLWLVRNQSSRRTRRPRRVTRSTLSRRSPKTLSRVCATTLTPSTDLWNRWIPYLD